MTENYGELGNPRILPNALPTGRPPDASSFVPLGSDMDHGDKESLDGAADVGQFPQVQEQESSTVKSGVQMSYAGIVNKPLVRNGTGQEGSEGVVCDSNKVESCDGKVDEGVASSVKSAIPRDKSLSNGVSTEERGLFGPWMTVENRRRRLQSGGPSSSRGKGKHVGMDIDNRFAALVNDQGEQMEEPGIGPIADKSAVDLDSERLTDISIRASTGVTKNAALIESNPGRKAKGVRRVFDKAVVVPMVEGQQVVVVEHVPLGSDSRHAAVSLLENGQGKSRAEGVMIGKNHGGRTGVKDTALQGLKVRKPSAARTISRPVLSEWVDTMHVQLNAITARSDHDPGGLSRATIGENGDLEPMQSKDSGSGVLGTADGVVLGEAERRAGGDQ
ncbi:hypothetical protein V6N13_098265 [Hibiscus sabdariffa]